MKCEAYGTSRFSLAEISDALRYWNVEHVLRLKASCAAEIKVPGKGQNYQRVVLTDDLTRVQANAVNFISASIAELSLTNAERLQALSIEESVWEALHRGSIVEFQYRELTALEYVDMIAKPSKLNAIQTELLRVQPYSLRKEANAAIIAYFRGGSLKALQRVMNKSSKLSKLATYVKSNIELRNAVMRLKTESVDQVSADTGIPSFELRYITKVKA